jgi:Flp pilus assembly pilin Flp
MNLLKTFKAYGLRFLKDEEGQTTTEYILILALVVIIYTRFKGRIDGLMQRATETVGGNIEKALQPDQ